ncbi:MAG: hypothetical protein Q8R37_00730 [Nanoarchaeota archaeon]|nr:hypothetical protein [Nanoarchaeota archaeon]
MNKELYLLVLDDGVPIRKSFAELNVDTLEYTVDRETYTNHWNWSRNGTWTCFEPEQLIEKYLASTEIIYTLFKPLFAADTTFSLYDKIRSVGMTFGGSAAYNTRRSGYPDVSDSVAYYSRDEGIVQSISYRSLDRVGDDSIHEFGHALDHLLNHVNYTQRTPVMAEVMAIFVEETLGINNFYLQKPHRQAKEILRCLAHTRFSLLDFTVQWEFLNLITDENDLAAWISSRFPLEKPLIKIIDFVTSFGKSSGIK